MIHKKKLVFFMSVIVISILFVLIIKAEAAPAPENPDNPIQSDNNLSWGVNNGTYLDYILTADINIPNATYHVSEPMYMLIEIVGSIPDNFPYIPSPKFSAYWAANGSRFYLGDYFVFGSVLHSVYNPAIPIGNWTLLKSYSQEAEANLIYPNFTMSFVDNSLEWGYRYSYAFYYSGIEFWIESETIWYKSDGSLESVHLAVNFNETEIYTVTLARINGITPMTIISVAGVTIFGIATVVLSVQYIRERKASS